jgi:hypothetical protein
MIAMGNPQLSVALNHVNMRPSTTHEPTKKSTLKINSAKRLPARRMS